MKPYVLQALHRRLPGPGLRLAAVRAARGLRLRHLLVRVDTNDVCNLRCPMCPLSQPDREPLAPPMPVARFAQLAAELLPRTRWLYLSCGTEPLATPHFDQILDEVGGYRVPFVSFCTNGLLLRERFLAAALRNRVSEITVSVDGASREVYERVRVGASWAVLQDRLRALTAALAARRGHAPELRFNFTVQQDNAHEIDAFVTWALAWRPATLQLRCFRPVPGAVKQSDGAGTVRAFAAALPRARARCAAAGVRLQTAEVPDEGYAKNVLAVAGSGSEPVHCALPWLTLYVKPDGQVQPCPVQPPVGNLFEQTYAELQRAPALRELRASLPRRPQPLCSSCARVGASGL